MLYRGTTQIMHTADAVYITLTALTLHTPDLFRQEQKGGIQYSKLSLAPTDLSL